MRRSTGLMVAVMLLSIAATGAVSAEETNLRVTPAQVVAPRAESSWTAGKVVAVGVGAVAGMMIANATLPLAWGMATPIAGTIVGGMVGSWAYAKSTEPAPMIRQRASMSAEAPSLFHLASITAQ